MLLPPSNIVYMSSKLCTDPLLRITCSLKVQQDMLSGSDINRSILGIII